VNDKEYDRERRRQARLERLGTNQPKCLFCPEDDPSCLELHHLSGKDFGEDCIIVCRNCHRKLSDRQKDHPRSSTKNPNTPERRGYLQLGIADALELLGVPGLLLKHIRETGWLLIEYGQPIRVPGDEP
jgi:hypothetical protein